MRSVRALLCVFSAFVFLAALREFPNEYKAFEASSRPAIQVLQRGETGFPAEVRSRWGREAVLKRCLSDLGALSYGLLPGQLRRDLARQCERIAAQSLRGAPGFALAHMVLAQLSMHEGQSAKALEQLDRSRRLSPRLGWLAAHRLRLILRHAGGRGEALPDWAAQDVALLLEGKNGARSFATIFEARPRQQEELIAILETLPAAAQSLFFRHLRELRQARGGN